LIHKGLRANGEKDRATNGKIVYHTGGKRLTCSEPQPDPAVATAPDFQGAAGVRSCHYARHSTCAPANEAPVAKSSARRRSVLT